MHNSGLLTLLLFPDTDTVLIYNLLTQSAIILKVEVPIPDEVFET